MYQRSGDMGLGIPFNIASASLMTHIFARLSGLQVGEFIHTVADAHLYKNHFAGVSEQTGRTPRPYPKLVIKDRGQSQVEDFEYSDFILEGYTPYPSIKMEMAV
jgi:thymidylate synthase